MVFNALQETVESWKARKAGMHSLLSPIFAHRRKPGKRETFLLGFPGFPRLLVVNFLAFQETVESWKARKVRSLLGFQEILERVKSQHTPSLPGFSLGVKKGGKTGIWDGIPGSSWLFFAAVILLVILCYGTRKQAIKREVPVLRSLA